MLRVCTQVCAQRDSGKEMELLIEEPSSESALDVKLSTSEPILAQNTSFESACTPTVERESSANIEEARQDQTAALHCQAIVSSTPEAPPDVFQVRQAPTLLTSRGPAVEAANGLKAVAAAEPVLRADYSGRWCMTNAEGDIGQMLADAGVHWAIRKMAKSMNYGIGKTYQVISQSGDEFIIEHLTPTKNTTMKFRVGAGYQETVGVDGNPVIVKATWDGQCLIMECKKPSGQVFPPTRRYMKDGMMVIAVPVSTGDSVKRFFTKQ